MNEQVLDNMPVQFTPAAILQLQKQLAKQPGAVLRLFVKTAGCSGLQYKFDTAAAPLADDVAYAITPTFSIYIEKKSIPFIEGTLVDYIKEGLNAHFAFKNPLQKGSCGCGESFYV